MRRGAVLSFLLVLGVLGDRPVARETAFANHLAQREDTLEHRVLLTDSTRGVHLRPADTVQLGHHAERRVLHHRASRPALLRPAQAVVVGGLGRGRLQQLIQRSIRPRVRDCFAQARAGNPHWSARAVLVLTIEGSDIAAASVETEAGDTLRQCILQGITYLLVPEPAEGELARTVVRYPFVSPGYRVVPARSLEPATVELLDLVFHEEAITSPLSLLRG